MSPGVKHQGADAAVFPAGACGPVALNASWSVVLPCGKQPSKESAKNIFSGTPFSPSPGTFSNPNFL